MTAVHASELVAGAIDDHRLAMLIDGEPMACNLYNTEVSRLDACSASGLPNGDLVPAVTGRKFSNRHPDRPDTTLELDANTPAATIATTLGQNADADALPDDDHLLFTPNYELVEHLIPADSINNKSFTDVTFIVGPAQHSKKYVGHRVLLAMTSPVFETMFYGDMADKSKYIRIADVAPIGFENLLRYAYTDSLNLATVEDAMLTAYAAKKYLLPQLLRECLTYIEHNIGPSTACVVFEFAHVLNSQQLVLQAMNLIDRQTISVITSKSFNHVQATTVEFVANRKYLNLSTEFALFNAALNWALAEARRRQLEPTDWTGIRSILAEGNCILSAVRFLAMSQEEFAKAIAKTSSYTRVAAPALAHQQQQPVDNNDHDQDDSGQQHGTSGSNGLAAAAGGSSSEAAEQQAGGGGGGGKLVIDRIDTESSNGLLSQAEQRAIFLNLALGDVAKLPPIINKSTQIRQAPPEYFTLKRFKSSASAGGGGGGGATQTNLMVTTTTTRSIKSIASKFQCLSENIFIVGLTIPIRLDASSYANRTPKFECHLKFTTKTTLAGSSSSHSATGATNDDSTGAGAMNGGGGGGGGVDASTLLMDTIDESLHISIARDRDCLVRLKRPILVRMGNLNELTLTFQTYALDEDIVALRTPKARSANFGEQTDGENISWLFFRTAGVEFSELHYYY